MVGADAGHDLRGSRARRHVDDGRTGKNLAFGDLIIRCDGGDDGNIHHRHGRLDGLRRSRGVDDHAGRALHLGHHGQLRHAWTGSRAAAHADEQWHLRHREQRLRDYRLSGERIHREYGIGVGVADDDRVGGVGERFERMPFNGDAAATLGYDLRNPGVGGREPSLDPCGAVGAA